jgi:hypothetical protein
MSKTIGRQRFGQNEFSIQATAVAWILLALTCCPLTAQNATKAGDLTPDEVVPPAESANQLTVKFMLPVPDAVSSFEVLAGGTPIDKNKIIFKPADQLPDLRCAVLLLVDKALANGPNPNKNAKEKLPDVEEAIRGTLRKLIPNSANASFQFGIATYSATNVLVLAAIQSNNKSFLEQAISPKYLKFDGQGAELLYHGAKEAIVNSLGKFQADRKFLIIVSDGISKDTADTEADVVKAAHDAKVHICTIGFPKSVADAAQLEKLSRLADQTAGVSWSAEGRELSLPTGWDSNLIKYMLSGGRGEVNLAGRSAPLNLEFKVKTNADRLFGFTYRLESMPTAPASINPSPSATPEKLPLPSSASSPAWWGDIKNAAKEHLPLVIGAFAALVLGLALVSILIMRKGRTRKPDQDDDTTTIPTEVPLPLPDDTHIPENVAPVLAWLVSLDADSTRHAITKTAVRIGRKPDNDLVMRNDSVSSHHAEILRRGDEFMIADLGASNGVFVSGKRVEKSPLENGDIIELGEVRLRFTLNQSDN